MRRQPPPTERGDWCRDCSRIAAYIHSTPSAERSARDCLKKHPSRLGVEVLIVKGEPRTMGYLKKTTL